MKFFWVLFYNLIVLPLLVFSVPIFGSFNEKARRAIQERKGLFPRLIAELSRLGPGPRLWIHASSMGEYEQARPLLRALRRQWPKVKIILTLFSPSVFSHARDDAEADVVTYLPFDTPWNVFRMFRHIRPRALVIVRHDPWPNQIWEAKRRKVPVLVMNAALSEHSRRGLPISKEFHRYVYRDISRILAISEEDALRIEDLTNSPRSVEVIGDTRFDQVGFRMKEAFKNGSFDRFKRLLSRNLTPPHALAKASVLRHYAGGGVTWVAGSTWPRDEEMVLTSYRNLHRRYRFLRLILAPHEPTETALSLIETVLDNFRISYARLSQIEDASAQPHDVILVDRVGLLAHLYGLGQMAFVGGSFGPGVHSVLEPAVCSIPVLFGPRYANAFEARLLLEKRAALCVHNADEMEEWVRQLLASPERRRSLGLAARKVVEENLGATQRLLPYLEPYLS